MDTRLIRVATEADAPRLLEIYAPYVKNTAISFEYETPSLEEFSGRVRATLARFPYLAAAREGKIVGYAYAGAFKTRAAYSWSVETSIYVESAHRGEGVGRALYEALEDCLREQGVTNVNACVAAPKADDEYLTRASIRFHEHMGYRLVGEFSSCACKFGRWYDMVWMEKHILPHDPDPAPARPFPLARAALRRKYGLV